MNLLNHYQNYPNDFRIIHDEKLDLYKVIYLNMGIDWSIPHALEARGIVLDKDGNIVSRPYNKFFNYKQYTEKFGKLGFLSKMCSWEPFLEYEVLEKLDGSLVIMSTYQDKLLVTSSGSISGDYPQLFYKYIEENFSKEVIKELIEIGRENTLMFEYVSPHNKIVLNYKNTSMVLTGIRENKTGYYAHYGNLKFLGDLLGIPVVKKLSKLSLDELLKEQKEAKGIEGFIIVFENGKRLKIKTEEYVDLHSYYNMWEQGISTKRTTNAIIDKLIDDTLDDILSDPRLTEEVKLVCIKIMTMYTNFYNKLEGAKLTIKDKKFNRAGYFTQNSKKIDEKYFVGLALSGRDNYDEDVKKYILKELEKEKRYTD